MRSFPPESAVARGVFTDAMCRGSQRDIEKGVGWADGRPEGAATGRERRGHCNPSVSLAGFVVASLSRSLASQGAPSLSPSLACSDSFSQATAPCLALLIPTSPRRRSEAASGIERGLVKGEQEGALLRGKKPIRTFLQSWPPRAAAAAAAKKKRKSESSRGGQMRG